MRIPIKRDNIDEKFDIANCPLSAHVNTFLFYFPL